MTATRPMTALQIRAAGLTALMKELGPAGMVRFLQAAETGSGDYTAERERWLRDGGVGDAAKAVREWRLASE